MNNLFRDKRATVLRALVALAALGGLLISSSAPVGAQQPPCEDIVLDFAGLPHGTILGEQFADEGIHISAIANEGRPNELIVFDSNRSGTPDPDLEVDIGNLAIIPENITDADGDGLVDRPSDSERGGTQIYTFDHDRIVNSFVIVDIDHGDPDSHFATAFDAAGNVIVRVPIPIGADGNVQTIEVNAEGVRRLEIMYRDSAGVTDIDLECPPEDQPPEAECIETTNPHGKNVPPAGSTTLPGPKGGQNEDGFYLLGATDDVDPDPQIFVVDTGTGPSSGPSPTATRSSTPRRRGESRTRRRSGATTARPVPSRPTSRARATPRSMRSTPPATSRTASPARCRLHPSRSSS